MNERIVFHRDRSAPIGALVLDVSASGAFLFSSEKLSIQSGVVLLLPVRCQAKKRMLPLHGRVVRIDSRANPPLQGYGVRFDEGTDEAAREQLREFVRQESVTDPHHRLNESHRIHREPVAMRTVRGIEPVRFDRSVTNPGALLAGKRVRKAKPSRLTWKAIGAISLATAIGLLLLFQQFESNRMIYRLRAHVPITQASVTEEVLRAQTPLDWIQTTTRVEKQRALRNLASEMHKNQIYGAILRDSQGQTVAMILKNPGNLSDPGIRVMR